MKSKLHTHTIRLFALISVITLVQAQEPNIEIPDVPEPEPNTEPVPEKPAATKKETPKAVPVDPAPEKVTKPKEEQSTTHIIEACGSLSLISAKVYSRPGYWRILKLHNGVSPEKLQAGQEIKAPDLNWLLADSGFTAMYPEVTKDLMTARKMFMEVENRLEDSIKSDTITPNADDQKKIKEAVKLINKCRKKLMEKRKGVKAPPAAAVLQLRTATQRMLKISGGTQRAAANQNLVHEHLSNSLVYAVLWARNGFK